MTGRYAITDSFKGVNGSVGACRGSREYIESIYAHALTLEDRSATEWTVEGPNADGMYWIQTLYNGFRRYLGRY